MEDLILEVEKNPSLYDKRLPSYKDSDLKALIWQQISSKLKLSEDVARKRWINLRDAYVKYEKRRKEVRSGSSAEFTSKYKYACQMEFLKPHIHVRETSTNLTKEEVREHDDREHDEGSDHDEEDDQDAKPASVSQDDQEAGPSYSAPSSFPYTPKKPPKKKPQQELHDAMLGYFRSRTETSTPDPFFLNIAETLQRLPQLQQSKLKLQIFELVSKAEIEFLSVNDE